MEIMIDGNSFQYEITRKKMKRMVLRMNSDLILRISCPKYITIREIENFIIKSKDYILKRQKEIKNQAICRLSANIKPKDKLTIFGITKEIEFEIGETRVVESEDKIIVFSIDEQKIYSVLENYIKQSVESEVEKMCQKAYEKFGDFGYPKIKYKVMKSKWGCCFPNRNLLEFSYLLYLLPKEVIEGVVYHEFTHFLEKNHSKRFYRLLEKYYPNYQQGRKYLKKIIL